MKQNVTLVLLGVLIGAVLMLAIPASAHHNPGFKKLKDRVWYLEQAFKDNNCSFGETVTWGSALGNPFGDPTLRCDS